MALLTLGLLPPPSWKLQILRLSLANKVTYLGLEKNFTLPCFRAYVIRTGVCWSACKRFMGFRLGHNCVWFWGDTLDHFGHISYCVACPPPQRACVAMKSLPHSGCQIVLRSGKRKKKKREENRDSAQLSKGKKFPRFFYREILDTI